MAKKKVETIEGTKGDSIEEKKEIQFSQSPVSNIIRDIWQAPIEEPPTIKSPRKRSPIKPKGGGSLRPEKAPLPPTDILKQNVEGQGRPVTLTLSGEQLLATVDGLKLLLAKLGSSDPQPLRAIYVTVDLLRGLEGITIQKLRELIGEGAQAPISDNNTIG